MQSKFLPVLGLTVIAGAGGCAKTFDVADNVLTSPADVAITPPKDDGKGNFAPTVMTLNGEAAGFVNDSNQAFFQVVQPDGQIAYYQGYIKNRGALMASAAATKDQNLIAFSQPKAMVHNIQPIDAAAFFAAANAELTSGKTAQIIVVARATDANPQNPHSYSIVDNLNGSKTLILRQPALVEQKDFAAFVPALQLRQEEADKSAAPKTSALVFPEKGPVGIAVRAGYLRHRA